MTEREIVQALFVQERLVASALDEAAVEWLAAEIRRRQALNFAGDDQARTSAYEQTIARLAATARELAECVIAGDLQVGEMVTLTQNFYIRRASEQEGRFRTGLDTDRGISVEGRFSTSWLIGSTGQSETFGHKRLSMLAYVDSVDLNSAESPKIALRPVFIGWRLLTVDGWRADIDDRREMWAQQIDQFAGVEGVEAASKDLRAVSRMPEEEVKQSFAAIIGEPFVFKDWGGELSDLFTNRLTSGGEPLSAAFAFKGPALRGTLRLSGMGSNGDQGLRLAGEDADLMVVQHHAAIAADVRNLMRILARHYRRRYMIIDGETTARILRAYDKLP